MTPEERNVIQVALVFHARAYRTPDEVPAWAAVTRWLESLLAAPSPPPDEPAD